ncbi:MAG TPA: universal stress protein [Steroidobacteraceae bacterium]|jgi:universal stress protein E|nr:universal stress protein [Steroidobacteraceae bacterium]
MRSIRRILVAIKDPASRSTPTLNKAVQLARGFGAQLELFHVLTVPIAADTYLHGGRSFEDAQRELREPAIRQLTTLATRLAGRGRQRRLKITVATQWDAPAYEAIIRRASVIKADLIIAERHAGRHIAPALLHLNDWELLRLSPLPVLLVKNSRTYRHPVVLAAVDPTHSMDKPARLDKQILRVGAAVAEALRGHLHAVHSYIPVLGGARKTYSLDVDGAARLNTKIAEGARRRYDRVLKDSKIPRTRRHLLSKSPADAISTLAASLRSAIVVMGSVSRSGLERVFIGNTAEDLLDRLSCDLLVVKPPGFKARIPSTPAGARIVPPLVLG